MMTNKKTLLIAISAVLISFFGSFSAYAQTPEDWEKLKGDVVVYMANDLGRNGYYDQKPIAELMGNMAETLGPECVVAAGDVHHFEGVASVNDPLWMTNYELIYSHPELMIAWYPLLGNHEYRGNTQAVLDYGKVSRRWEMGGRYYTRTFDEDGTTLRLIFVDTTPLISKYREESDKYPDACKQNVDEQLKWLDNLLPVLKKYNNVSLYVCGHIHNFQHIRMKGDNIDYVVNSSGSLARKVKPIEGTVFCSPEPGFSVISATKKALNMYMIDKTGKVLHTITKTK